MIRNVGAGPCARPNLAQSQIIECNNTHPYNACRLQKNNAKLCINAEDGQPQGAAPTSDLSLYDVIGRFKSLATKHSLCLRGKNLWTFSNPKSAIPNPQSAIQTSIILSSVAY